MTANLEIKKLSPMEQIQIHAGCPIEKFDQFERVTENVQSTALDSMQRTEVPADNLSFREFVNLVDSNRENLKKIDFLFQKKVVKKCYQDAQKYFDEEKDYSFVYKLFHKIGQLFKGHGFRTEGEWAHNLANELDKPLKVYFRNKWSEDLMSNNLNLEAINEYINDMPTWDIFAVMTERGVFLNWKDEQLESFKNILDQKHRSALDGFKLFAINAENARKRQQN